MKTRNRNIAPIATLTAFFMTMSAGLFAQQPVASSSEENRRATEMERHIDALSDKIERMSRLLEQSQRAMDAMRAEIGNLRNQLDEKRETEEAERTAASLRADIEKLQEKSEVLDAEVRQHDQSKVESASKYPVRLSGTLLFTSIVASGTTDNADLPIVASPQPSNSPAGSLTATARQSILAIDAAGSHLWGANASAAASIDFFGGIPYADYATSSGTVRLRNAHATLKWPSRALTAAFEQPIVSPRNPTSWVTVGEPALAWSGNLWTWSPQLVFRQDALLPGRHLSAEIALVDPAAPGAPQSVKVRIPDAGESSRQPGYESRLSGGTSWQGHQVEFGAGGYYSRQSYEDNLHGDAWAGTADWKVALARTVEWSGEFYRGRAIGGLGGAAFKDYVTYNQGASFRLLDAEGGWAQLRFVLSPAWEANAAFGQDNPFGGELRSSDSAYAQDAYASLARNQTAFANFVFKPRASLLFSAEYRQIRSFPIDGNANRYRMTGLVAGYLF